MVLLAEALCAFWPNPSGFYRWHAEVRQPVRQQTEEQIDLTSRAKEDLLTVFDVLQCFENTAGLMV